MVASDTARWNHTWQGTAALERDEKRALVADRLLRETSPASLVVMASIRAFCSAGPAPSSNREVLIFSAPSSTPMASRRLRSPSWTVAIQLWRPHRRRCADDDWSSDAALVSAFSGTVIPVWWSAVGKGMPRRDIPFPPACGCLLRPGHTDNAARHERPCDAGAAGAERAISMRRPVRFRGGRATVKGFFGPCSGMSCIPRGGARQIWLAFGGGWRCGHHPRALCYMREGIDWRQTRCAPASRKRPYECGIVTRRYR